MMRRSRRRSRGQALVESALLLPILVVIVLGATDLAQAFRFTSDLSGASRAGMRSGIQLSTYDIGDAVRSEPNSVIANTTTVWGPMGAGGNWANCAPTESGASCGDPNGCPPADFATYNLVACFAVRSCTLNAASGSTPLQCTSYSAWNTRPTSGSNQGLQVLVVYKFTPATPLIGALAGQGGAIYLSSSTQGLELY